MIIHTVFTCGKKCDGCRHEDYPDQDAVKPGDAVAIDVSAFKKAPCGGRMWLIVGGPHIGSGGNGVCEYNILIGD